MIDINILLPRARYTGRDSFARESRGIILDRFIRARDYLEIKLESTFYIRNIISVIYSDAVATVVFFFAFAPPELIAQFLSDVRVFVDFFKGNGRERVECATPRS